MAKVQESLTNFMCYKVRLYVNKSSLSAWFLVITTMSFYLATKFITLLSTVKTPKAAKHSTFNNTNDSRIALIILNRKTRHRLVFTASQILDVTKNILNTVYSIAIALRLHEPCKHNEG